MENITLTVGETITLETTGKTLGQPAGIYQFNAVDITHFAKLNIISYQWYNTTLIGNTLHLWYLSSINVINCAYFVFDNINVELGSKITGDTNGYPAGTGISPGTTSVSTGGNTYGRLAVLYYISVILIAF